MCIQQRPVETTKVIFGNRSSELEADIRCAVISNGGVLITGPSGNAEAIAREIHRRGVRSREPFTAADCSDPDGLLLVLGGRAGGTLLLRDVDLLSPFLQSMLLARITERHWRVIASSTECPRVDLKPRLFYYLNMVYIVLGSPSPQVDRGGCGPFDTLSARPVR